MPFATKWMNLEGIRLSEVSQRKTNAVCYHLYVESKKQRKLVNIKKKKKEKKQTLRYRDQTSGYQWGEEGQEEQDRIRGLSGTSYYV